MSIKLHFHTNLMRRINIELIMLKVFDFGHVQSELFRFQYLSH